MFRLGQLGLWRRNLDGNDAPATQIHVSGWGHAGNDVGLFAGQQALALGVGQGLQQPPTKREDQPVSRLHFDLKRRQAANEALRGKSRDQRASGRPKWGKRSGISDHRWMTRQHVFIEQDLKLPIAQQRGARKAAPQQSHTPSLNGQAQTGSRRNCEGGARIAAAHRGGIRPARAGLCEG